MPLVQVVGVSVIWTVRVIFAVTFRSFSFRNSKDQTAKSIVKQAFP
jgi:hypothetical protein